MSAPLRPASLEVWRVSVPPGLQGVNFDADQAATFLQCYARPFFGEAMRAKWQVWRAYGTHPARLHADFFSFIDGIGLRPSAVQRVGHLIEPWGELLPIDIKVDGECRVFNCTYLSHDAVDVSRSQTPSTTSAVDTSYAFRQSVVRYLTLFKIPQRRGWTLLARGPHVPPEQDLYSVYCHSRLVGLKFDRIWTGKIASQWRAGSRLSR